MSPNTRPLLRNWRRKMEEISRISEEGHWINNQILVEDWNVYSALACGLVIRDTENSLRR